MIDFIVHQYNLCYVSVCNGLHDSWSNVIAGSEFPVSDDTTLAVSCKEGYNNAGSDQITCNTYLYNDYSYTSEPHCILGKIILGKIQ